MIIKKFLIVLFALIITYPVLSESQEKLDKALYDASVEGKLEVVKKLIKKGAKANASEGSCLWWALDSCMFSGHDFRQLASHIVI